MTNLRSKLIRLAHARPDLRGDLLPLIRTGSLDDMPEDLEWGLADYFINTWENDDNVVGSLTTIARQNGIKDPQFVKIIMKNWNGPNGLNKIRTTRGIRAQQEIVENLIRDSWMEFSS